MTQNSGILPLLLPCVIRGREGVCGAVKGNQAAMECEWRCLCGCAFSSCCFSFCVSKTKWHKTLILSLLLPGVIRGREGVCGAVNGNPVAMECEWRCLCGCAFSSCCFSFCVCKTEWHRTRILSLLLPGVIRGREGVCGAVKGNPAASYQSLTLYDWLYLRPNDSELSFNHYSYLVLFGGGREYAGLWRVSQRPWNANGDVSTVVSFVLVASLFACLASPICLVHCFVFISFFFQICFVHA